MLLAIKLYFTPFIFLGIEQNIFTKTHRQTDKSAQMHAQTHRQTHKHPGTCMNEWEWFQQKCSIKTTRKIKLNDCMLKFSCFLRGGKLYKNSIKPSLDLDFERN